MKRSLVLVALLALGGAALAQEEGVGGPSHEPTDEQVRLCPELKGAIGRKKDQLLALFFELDDGKVDAKKVRNLFSIEQDAPLLEGFLDERGRYRAQIGLRAVVAGLGSSGFAWALDRFENGKPESRGRVLDALHATDAREAWKFLESRLDDTRAVPDWRASHEAPPGYQDLRVCDHATRALGAKLVGVADPPDTRTGSLLPVKDRDARIAKVKEFLAKDAKYRDHVAKAPSLDVDEKTRALLKKLGAE